MEEPPFTVTLTRNGAVELRGVSGTLRLRSAHRAV